MKNTLKISVLKYLYNTWDIRMNSFPDEELLLESYQQYIIAKYKASDCSKIKPDLPSLFFTSSLWNQENFRSGYFWLNLKAWPASTLRQNSCKIRCRQKSVFENCLSVFDHFAKLAPKVYPKWRSKNRITMLCFSWLFLEGKKWTNNCFFK